MKRGKELKLDINPNYKIKIGTVDNKNPKSIYINLSAWGELKKNEDEINYDKVINSLRKRIKNNINKNINIGDFHQDKYIVELDMRSSGISDKKRSYMSCEITLYQKNLIPVNKPYMVDTTTTIIENIISNCLDDQPHFTFYKTKK
jgi:hypothetical protein